MPKKAKLVRVRRKADTIVIEWALIDGPNGPEVFRAKEVYTRITSPNESLPAFRARVLADVKAKRDERLAEFAASEVATDADETGADEAANFGGVDT